MSLLSHFHFHFLFNVVSGYVTEFCFSNSFVHQFVTNIEYFVQVEERESIAPLVAGLKKEVQTIISDVSFQLNNYYIIIT